MLRRTLQIGGKKHVVWERVSNTRAAHAHLFDTKCWLVCYPFDQLVSHQKSRGREVVKQAKPILILNSVSKYYENKMHKKLQNKNTLII